ncbi:peptide/nickel transport system substrate-binding protein [Lipingzhangella halophila]|uniref:Peptide/nickel transport system substrate-binding protein n=1 Tax=Lipingzhangella halophila TaxID=1783352 RepID=A0A7W7RJ20_9ACTN|nr:ABC transporter substrate-binding protein [Lipingzhangella halophila]MBB4932886.1 peptide/nickel transport system substrate-binding protein [Lipingzhangella halophila]
MRRRGSRALAALLAALALAVSGCTGNAGTSEGPPPGSGGEARIVLGVDAVRGLDPAHLFNLTPSGDANRMAAIYGLLFWVDSATGEVHPQLGKSLTSNEAGDEWLMTLREDVEFTDGTPLNAEAVKFNYDRIKDPDTASPLADMLDGATVSTDGEYRVKLSLDEPNLAFDTIIATSLAFIASPTAIRNDPDFANNPVGAGPFKLDEWIRDYRMTLVRNKDYFRTDRPYLDQVTYLTLRDPLQRSNMVATGQADAAVPGSELSFIDVAESDGMRVASAGTGGGVMLMLNTAQAPFDDLRARRAIQLAINTDDMASVIDPGSSAPSSLYGPDSRYYTEGTLTAGDREQAENLFDELAEEDGPVTFTVSVPSSGLFVRSAEYLQSRLGEFDGVRVEIEILDNASLDQKVFSERDFQLSVQIVHVSNPEPNLAKLLATDGQTNYMGYSNPEVDQALEDGRTATSDDERLRAYNTVEELVAEEVPVLPVRQQMPYTIHSPDLEGLVLQGDGSLLYDRLQVSR